jgi:hypothetical protein
MVPLASSTPIALAFLFERLKWPVPMVRWRAAREVRNLLNTAATRTTATEQLLDILRDCACESEVCALLSIILLTKTEARPTRSAVISRVKYPSLLSNMLLERIYGKGQGGQPHLHAVAAPSGFEAGSYFDEHSTAHAPPVLGNNLRRLERVSGLPFRKQWGFEWQILRDRLGVPFTKYPHYFDDSAEAGSGVTGQFWQRMRDVYLSAYLRTLGYAVNEWRLPREIAESYCLEIVDGIGGIFEIEPGVRPTWLSDITERFCAPNANFGAIAKDLFKASQQNGMVVVSIHMPVAASVQKYARLQMTTHLITENYKAPAGASLCEETPPFMIEGTFEVTGAPPDITLDEASSAGQTGGEQASVCIHLFPMPFGCWHGDLFNVGLTIPAPYVVKDAQISCTADGIQLKSRDGKLLSTTRVWNDGWTPPHPRGGSTRCGVVTMMDASCLEEAQIRLVRRLALFVRLQIWDRETDFGNYSESQHNELVVL